MDSLGAAVGASAHEDRRTVDEGPPYEQDDWVYHEQG
jgi:hypothetical protein